MWRHTALLLAEKELLHKMALDLAIGIEIEKKGIQDIKNSSTTTSSVHYSGTNVSDDKEKPVGKDSVSKMNGTGMGEDIGPDPVSFGRLNVIVETKLVVLQRCVNWTAGS